MPTIDSVTGAPANTQDAGDEIYEWSADGTFEFSAELPSLVFAGSAGDIPDVAPDFVIVVDTLTKIIEIDDSAKTIQTTPNSFTIRI